MSHFEPEPSLLLPDKQTTLDALNNPEWMEWKYPLGWHVKSQWLCDQLNHYETTIGYPYNSAVQRWIEKNESIGPFDENGSPLSRLIYIAQKYLHSDRLRADGWVSGSPAILTEALQLKKPIEILKDSIFGGEHITKLTVREVKGELYPFAPKKRKYAVSIGGEPVRIAI